MPPPDIWSVTGKRAAQYDTADVLTKESGIQQFQKRKTARPTISPFLPRYETVDVFLKGSGIQKFPKKTTAPSGIAFLPDKYETDGVLIESKLRKLQKLEGQRQKIAPDRDDSPLKSGRDPKTEAKAYAKELFPSGSRFYDVLRDLARRARERDASAIRTIKKIDSLYSTNRHFKDEIANRVRVKATKRGGDLAGSGLDELFMTSKTIDFLKWAAGMLEGKEAESTVTLPNGKKLTFTVLDLQEKFRLPTSAVLTIEGEGHTGALLKERTGKGYLTRGQPGLHEYRQTQIELAETPLEALHAGLRAHIEITPNASLIKQKHTKGTHASGLDLAKTPDRLALQDRFIHQRDALKVIAAELERVLRPPSRLLLRSLSPLASKRPPTYEFTGSALPRLSAVFNRLAGGK